MNNSELDKGYKMEESLRKYFLDRSFFVVRGIKFVYKNETVTDIDLWLYNRASPFKRDLTIVDIKNKKSPQALERILWTKGLTTLLGYDHCIVATTDTRRVVTEFGSKNGVTVVNGKTLTKIQSVHSTDRLTEEEFIALMDADQMGKFTTNWVYKIEVAKSKLISIFGFSSCNFLLEECSYFLNQATINPRKREAAVRAFYLMFSLFLISLDYSYRDFAFDEEDQRRMILTNGFLFGNQGQDSMDKILSVLKLGRNQVEHKPTEGTMLLADFFSKTDNSKYLFEYACYFERLAYNKKFVPPSHIEPELKDYLMVLLDVLELDRKQIMSLYP
jgi:hypothetical protein